MYKKKPNKLQLIIALCVFVINVSVYSQVPTTGELLLGTWTFSVAPSVNKMPNDVKQDYATSVELQNHVASFYAGRQLTFTANGFFTILLGTGQNLSGQWSIQNNTLGMLDTNGGNTSYQIGGLDNSNLLLIAAPDVNPNKRALFPELYFSKN